MPSESSIRCATTKLSKSSFEASLAMLLGPASADNTCGRRHDQHRQAPRQAG